MPLTKVKSGLNMLVYVSQNERDKFQEAIDGRPDGISGSEFVRRAVYVFDSLASLLDTGYSISVTKDGNGVMIDAAGNRPVETLLEALEELRQISE